MSCENRGDGSWTRAAPGRDEPFDARQTVSRCSFAAASIQRVVAVSAGPPCGGLYLNPPSSGGLCDGVITMPSARPAVRPRLWVRIAWDTAGVGV